MPESNNQKRKVALFGGTFDPVHEGHLEVAERAVDSLGLDQVVFLPCRQSPHKSQVTGASEQQRLEMLKLATASARWAEVSDWEYHQPSPSFSWRTAEAFRELKGDCRLFWLMGWDQWEVLPSWNRFEYLAELVEFIVHARDGNSGRMVSYSGARVDYVRGEHPASSSEVRCLMSAGQSLPSGWLSPEVADFVKEHRLYLE